MSKKHMLRNAAIVARAIRANSEESPANVCIRFKYKDKWRVIMPVVWGEVDHCFWFRGPQMIPYIEDPITWRTFRFERIQGKVVEVESVEQWQECR